METTVINCLTKILEIDNIRFLDLRDNPFCSLDQKSFFMKIDLDNDIILNKLIWVNRWDFNDVWPKLLLQSDEILEYIKNIHMNYYSLKN